DGFLDFTRRDLAVLVGVERSHQWKHHHESAWATRPARAAAPFGASGASGAVGSSILAPRSAFAAPGLLCLNNGAAGDKHQRDGDRKCLVHDRIPRRKSQLRKWFASRDPAISIQTPEQAVGFRSLAGTTFIFSAANRPGGLETAAF